MTRAIPHSGPKFGVGMMDMELYNLFINVQLKGSVKLLSSSLY